MKLRTLKEHILYTECDSSNDRPVLGYIRGRDFSVMIDAGNSAGHVSEYNSLLLEKELKLPKYCIITHWHWDHTFGMHALNAETIAHFKTNEELNRMSSWAWNDKSMKERLISREDIEFADEHIRAEYSNLSEIKVVPAALTFDSKMVIDCGGITCVCMHLESAHSDDSVVILIPEEKVIFIGDIYNDNFYQNHYRDLNKNRELHRELSAIDFDIAVVGHSEPVRKIDLLHFLQRFL